MHYLFFIFSAFLLAACGTSTKEANDHHSLEDRIDSLILHKDYFKARDLFDRKNLELGSFDKIRFEAYLNNFFNRPKDSNRSIETLFSEFELELSDSLKANLLDIQVQNSIKLQEYDKAFTSARLQLDKYASHYSEKELSSIRNTQNIWKGLIGQPKQNLTMPGTQVVPLVRDKAGLSNLPVTFGEDSLGFIFDTGANISTVTKSTASAMGMKILDASFKVKAISGVEVNSGLAVAPSFSIGDILIENAVFLVFPDSALAFPPINYQINGIIGYPVMAAMKEIQLAKAGSLIVPVRSSATTVRNMAMNFLSPLIQLPREKDTLVFTFDTGADETTLYRDYYLRYRDEIEPGNTAVKINMGGAGGKAMVDGYYIDLSLTVNNKEIVLDSVEVITESLINSEHIYGNIGQDLISKFDTLTINFEEMFIHLK